MSANWHDRIIIKRTPNYYLEAVELMDDYFRWKIDNEAETDGIIAWEDQHLITNLDNFILTASEIDTLYKDTYQYIVECKRKAVQILAPLGGLQHFFSIKAQEHTNEMPGFLKVVLVMSDVQSTEELTRDDFVTYCLAGLYELSNTSQLEKYEIGSAEEQALYEKLSNPNYDIKELLDVITCSSFTDGEKMKLIRFFQEIDRYYETIKKALLQIEAVCKQNYDIVKKRFEEKVQELDTGKGKSYFKDLFDNANLKIEDYRKEENIYVEVSIIAYGSISVRFHSWKRLRLRIFTGLLFSELDKLENKSKRRDQMAQRQLKAISDPTRYKIIRQLSLRPHYVQELADRLKLTAATLSHHLDHLLQVRLVGVIIEGRRSYYNLNADELTELSKTLKHMAERSRLEE
jgi:DNA-binding transcriptional ArsR family regulator/uncharacterized protein YktA (UPF0223 family)